jgi:hypothetical protein
MALPELLSTTGAPKIDKLLQGFLGLCELTFPGRVLAYYLGGSYSDGNGLDVGPTHNSSDLDLFVIFKGGLEAPEEARFGELLLCCYQFGTIDLDAHPLGEDRLFDAGHPNILTTLIKIASLHLYGSDIKEKLPQLSLDHYLQEVINHGLYHSGLPRRDGKGPAFPLNTPLVYPVALPDPARPLLGYDMPTRYPDGTEGPPGTRLLIAIALWAATLNLVLKTGRYTGTKSQSVKLYLELIQDEWTPLVEAMFYRCKKEWGHQIPAGEAEQNRLLELARQVPALENHFLRQARAFMLEQLGGGDEASRLGALTGFQCLVFPGDTAVLEAVRAARNDPSPEIAAAAARTAQVWAEFNRQLGSSSSAEF